MKAGNENKEEGGNGKRAVCILLNRDEAKSAYLRGSKSVDP